MAGLKIKEAKLVDELTEDCLFPISDGSGEPKVADFSKVKNLLGDAKQVERTVTGIQKKINYLTRNGQDSELSVKDIAERVINPTSTNVETLIGNDVNKSVRTIATEVLTGASTGGDIDLGSYLSKSEAENIYEKKGTSYTKKEVDDYIIKPLAQKADKETVENLSERVGQAETNIFNNSNLLSTHSQDILTLQTEQGNQDTTIKQQGAFILALDENKADKSKVNTLSERVDQAENDIDALQSMQGTQQGAILEQAQNIANLYADLGTKASQDSVDALGGRVDNIGNIVAQKADSASVQALGSQISNKVDKGAYNTKVSALEASIKANAEYIVYLEGFSEEKANEAEDAAKAYTDEEIAKVESNVANISSRVDGKADNTRVLALESQISQKVELDAYRDKVTELEEAIESKYTKPAGGIPAKDLAAEVATETEVVNAIGAAVSDLNDKIDSKVSKTDLKDLKYTINGVSTTYNGLSEVNMKQIFVPTTIGNQGQLLQSMGGGEPQWTDLSTIKEDIKEAIGINDDKLGKIDTAIQEIESANGDYITISTKGGTAVPTKVIGANIASIDGDKNGLVTAQDIRASLPTELPNPKPLTLRINGFPTKTYKGDTETELKIFAPIDVGTNNQVVKCRDGVMADWGYVKWEEIEGKPDVINFAKDLTGVLEATPEEFTFRPSAGNKSIRDEGAVIRRIKGNTTVWGQLADITASLINSAYIFERSEDGMSFSITRVGSSATGFWCALNMNTAYRVLGHKFLFVADAEASNIASNADYVSVTNYAITTPNHNFNLRENRRELYSCISTPLDSGTNWQFAFYAYGNAKLTIHNLQCFDLTSIFGAGNEPTTYEAFKAIYPDIYPYCEPTIRNVKTTAIETVGFNQWDEEWELGYINASGTPKDTTSNIRSSNFIPVIGGATYYSKGGDCIIPCYDENKNFIPYNGETGAPVYYNSINVHNSTFVLPINTRYIKFWMAQTYGSIYNNDICINLSHTGVRNGEYEPYKKNTLLLPEIAKYFPDGMNGIGDVYDEINSENVVTRFGRVDLGTLAWEESSHKGLYGVTISDGKEQKKVNVITHKYLYRRDVLEVSGTTFEDKSLFNYYNTTNLQNALRIYIKDTTYSDVGAFKKAMQGVYLYYELAEHEIRPILEPIQLVYDVEDFGTERAITTTASKITSAPFRADIVYQFNAEGRIRDNGRNIERLEKSTNILSSNIERLSGRFEARFDNEFVVANGIEDDNDNCFYLPSTRSSDQRYNLASEQYVINNIPTEVATARVKYPLTSPPNFNSYNPDVVYEFAGSLTRLTIEGLLCPQDNYDHVWIIRFACSQRFNLSITPTVYWKDGIEPIFGDWGVCELKFHKSNLSTQGNAVYLGEWKMYIYRE